MLGIDRDVRLLARNLGLLDFLDLNAPTYARLTFEFLSSLEVVREDDEDNESSRVLTFQLFNCDHRISESQLGAYFRFPTSADEDHLVYPANVRMSDSYQYDEQKWWCSIAKEGYYEAQTSKAASIVHPAMRYFNRILTYALCSKDSLGAISREELCWLWMASHDQGELELVDFTQHLINRFLDIRDGVTLSGSI